MSLTENGTYPALTAPPPTLDLSKLGALKGGTLITEGSTTRDFSTRRFTGTALTLPVKARGGFVLEVN